MSSAVASAAQTLSRAQIRDNWNAVLASTIGWTLDSFDYFVVVMVLTEIAKDFGRTNAEVALTITITLAFRPLGAFLFGLMADRYGRRKPLMIDVVAFSILSVASGLAPNFTTFLIVRALFGIAMGGEWERALLLSWKRSHPNGAVCSPAFCSRATRREICWPRLRIFSLSRTSAGARCSLSAARRRSSHFS